MKYICSHCESVITGREHMCIATRSIYGEMVGSLVVYQPNTSKPNKQSTVPGYMKFCGSRAKKGVLK